jgi:hypothetical protein
MIDGSLQGAQVRRARAVYSPDADFFASPFLLPFYFTLRSPLPPPFTAPGIHNEAEQLFKQEVCLCKHGTLAASPQQRPSDILPFFFKAASQGPISTQKFISNSREK